MPLNLVDYAKRLKEEIEQWSGFEFSGAEQPIPEGAERYKLAWKPSDLPPPPETIPLADAREKLQETIETYLDNRQRKVLVVRGQPGIGKTHLMIQEAQRLARAGKRVLVLMPTHNHFNTLLDFDHFDPSLWYHWKATHAPHHVDLNGDSVAMCKFHDRAEIWMQKGYPLKSMCESVCSFYQSQCPYRQQADEQAMIIAGVHEHLVTGMSISDFHTVFVDEEPMRAHLSPRLIPVDGLITDGIAGGPIADLQSRLKLMCSLGQPISGKILLDMIGPLLSDVFAIFEDVKSILPSIPILMNADDVENVPYWYLPDLLLLLVREWEAWKQGQDDWLARIIASERGLTLLSRSMNWKSLPKKCVVIDATATEALYKEMFVGRKIEIEIPHVSMVGRIHQVTHRLYGKSTVVSGDTLGEHGQDALAIVHELIAQNGYVNPAVITYKAAKPFFGKIIGNPDMVGHFYGQRGANWAQECDVLFVVGSPTPADHQIMRDVTILFNQRMQPFATTQTILGTHIPTHDSKLRRYNYTSDDGMTPWRYHGGFWHDMNLHAMSDSRRELELVQAAHRARPLSRDVDVWMLTSVPTPLPLTSIHDEPPIGQPPGISWRSWIKIGPWLRTRDHVTYSALAEKSGMKVDYIRNQRWLDIIADHLPETWEMGLARKSGGRGRPSKTLSKKAAR